MKVINKSYKFKLNPTKEQKILLDKHFGSARFIYNYFLHQRKEQYQQTGKSDGYLKQSNTLSSLKKDPKYVWLRECNSQSLQFSLKSLELSYVNFFKGRTGFPKFKSKKNRNSFTTPQGCKVKDGKVFTFKFKDGIQYDNHREVRGEIKRMTFSKTPTGKYFVSILTEQEYQPHKSTGNVVGIDLGLKDFIITSDGVKIKNNKYTKQYERKLTKHQRHLSRKKKGSKSYENQRRKVTTIHEKISNCRKDYLHKVSTNLIKQYDTIVLEDLNIKGMIQNRKLSKHIQDVSWGTFIQMLQYKSDWNDKLIVRVNRFYPSSKTCNDCGWIKQDLNLSIREWSCGGCGVTHDRDLNAAKNILKEGLKILSVGHIDYRGGVEIRLDSSTDVDTSSLFLNKP